ncbi:lycopene cyclase domain-containing protein [Leucobacter sp. USHLN153]|uniref:lycopene cyclase domain-containing protein n=1 Tax=Leucobacter sp. USHLN153 TaxID=3081268 RepID=UPI00301A4F74
MTYALISIPFLLLALAVALALTPWRRRRAALQQWTAIGLAVVALAILTAVFDSVMIASDLFSYGHGHTLGVTIGIVPVEDFSYPIATALLAPSIWFRLTERREPRIADD